MLCGRRTQVLPGLHEPLPGGSRPSRPSSSLTNHAGPQLLTYVVGVGGVCDRWADTWRGVHEERASEEPERIGSGSSRIKARDRFLSLIHISEPTRLLSISYAVFCLKKKNSIHTFALTALWL
eukprot:TRINITY_DN27074_c0_g1_i1.p1 TRINITY_DN27074_c0_g1~~TRINITY_DN27074_c0_g1_i1.p1  ORF type:complete len:123 (+),score=7.32 TRINITY_DN27074_c0_g1_i1:46-414(+)